MSIRSSLAAGVALAALALAAPASAQSVTEAWRTGGFSMPESVSYDPASGDLFVSNIASPDMSANGEGYISRVAIDGSIVEERFTEGLNAPKGTHVADGMLYVAGVEELVVIDLASREVATRYAAPGAGFLNDVTLGDDGTIYVSETGQGAIYRVEGDELVQWVADPALAGANGVIVHGDALLVATLGDISGGFENLQPSNVKSVDLETGAVTDFGSAEPIGALDGIEHYGDGVMVTDNSAGRLLAIAADGTVTELGQTGPGSADHEFVADQNLVIVPMLQGNEVVAWTLAE